MINIYNIFYDYIKNFINLKIMNTNNSPINDTESGTLTSEEMAITIIYYSLAFLIFVVSLIFINKRI